MSSIHLRGATDDDATRVADILIDSRATFMAYAPSPRSGAEIRTWVAETLVPSGDVLVAERDGRVVAVMATAVESGVSWLTQMAVEPELAGQGIGSILLREALAVLPRPLRLYTFQVNLGARRFYERHGFKVLQLGDGSQNEENCPDVLYELP